MTITACYAKSLINNAFDGTDIPTGKSYRVQIQFSSSTSATCTVTDLNKGSSEQQSLTIFSSGNVTTLSDGIWRSDPDDGERFYFQTYSNGGAILMESKNAVNARAFYSTGVSNNVFQGLDIYSPHQNQTRFAINSATDGVINISPATGGGGSTWNVKRFAVAQGGNNPPSGNMVLIPAGEFSMGDPYSEGSIDELPVHTVYVSAFYMEKYLVTGGQWKDVYTWAKANGYEFSYTGASTADTHPVQAITWFDVVKWLNARSEKEGRTPAYYTDPAQTAVYRTGQTNVTSGMVKWTSNGYRLPTEAEWEKAARGGLAGQHFPWPSQGGNYISFVDCTKANYFGCKPNGTTPVGSYLANGYGLYDMAGNVWEWGWDWLDWDWYGKAGATGADTRGPDSGSVRVLRGGCWSSLASSLRCAYRTGNYSSFPTFTGDYVGFRAALGQP
ncbi:MAG: formylglycine-generating enzyme family protein [Deltaproteobacteria bacterium]|nr:formylglycine-generating enzyme family protein [Deltaproteobacteria bacterium]